MSRVPSEFKKLYTPVPLSVAVRSASVLYVYVVSPTAEVKVVPAGNITADGRLASPARLIAKFTVARDAMRDLGT